MSAEEFCRWRGYLRQHPAGWRWLGIEFAEIKREIAKGRVAPGKKLPDLRHFMRRSPEPMFYTRAKKEAEARKK